MAKKGTFSTNRFLDTILDILALFLFLTVALCTYSGNSSAAIARNSSSYTSSYMPIVIPYDIESPTEEESRIISDAKTAVKASLSTYDYLNWDTFDEITFKVCLFRCGEDPDDYAVSGLYRDANNTIYLSRSEFQSDGIHEIVAHEIIHALISNIEDSQYRLLGEGLTEYVAQIIFPTEYVSYNNSYTFADCAVTAHGLDAVLRSYMHGEYANLIETDLGEPGIKCTIDRYLPIVEFDDNSDPETYSNARDFIHGTIDHYRELYPIPLSFTNSHDP